MNLTPQEVATDGRFPTRNTNLAAAMGALRIPICNNGPVSVINDAQTGNRIVTFYFEPQGKKFCGEIHSCDQVDWAWRNQDKFESENPGHPLIVMRKSLMARDWINRIVQGKIVLPDDGRKAKFETDDWTLASCLKAMGVPLLRVTDKFQFPKIPDTFDVSLFDEGSKRWKQNKLMTLPISLARWPLEVRKLLIDEVNRTPTATYYCSGAPGSAEWTDLTLRDDLPKEMKDLLLERYFEEI